MAVCCGFHCFTLFTVHHFSILTTCKISTFERLELPINNFILLIENFTVVRIQRHVSFKQDFKNDTQLYCLSSSFNRLKSMVLNMLQYLVVQTKRQQSLKLPLCVCNNLVFCLGLNIYHEGTESFLKF